MIDFENLPRWCFASTSKYITDHSGINVVNFVEGTDRKDILKDTVEFRMDGPRLHEQSKGQWQIWIAINMLVSTTMNNQDFHEKHRILGKLVNALRGPIPVFKLGDGPKDNREELVGCLTVIQDRFNRIQVNHFGQIDQTVRLEQATVEARYFMYLSEE